MFIMKSDPRPLILSSKFDIPSAMKGIKQGTKQHSVRALSFLQGKGSISTHYSNPASKILFVIHHHGLEESGAEHPRSCGHESSLTTDSDLYGAGLLGS